MSETEITLARSYLEAADQDPVAALIRSVKDLAQTRRMLASLPGLLSGLYEDEPGFSGLAVADEPSRLAA